MQLKIKFTYIYAEVLGTVAKLTKTCQMRLGSKSMYFLLLEHQHTSGCSIWCELPQV